MRDNQKRTIRRGVQIGFAIVIATLIIGVLVFVTNGHAIPVLQPKGLIADQERNLILVTIGLGLIVVVPVLIMLFTIAWKYRASNTKAVYQPDFASHKGFEALWWGIPCIIILALGIITVYSTHALDPYKSINSQVKPVKIEVIALEWKWLFIYPEQNIATLNYLTIPSGTPIDLKITSDAPMNSFWVPALAGQVYAMSGMTTQLHLVADGSGTYTGSSANISGEGFADMKFRVNSVSPSEFASWARSAATTNNMLTSDTYQALSRPSKNIPDTIYSLQDTGLYNENVMKYMSPDVLTDAHGMGM